MRDYADITVLLDRSGSMSMIKNTMESAFDEFLVPHKDDKNNRVTLIQFDSSNDNEVIYTAQPILDVPKLKINPNGMTPLVDAFAKAIDATGKRLASMSTNDRPNGVIFVVITDGQENASKQYKRSDISERVNRQTKDYNWKFVYLGANQDAIGEAQSYGINPTWAMNYSASDIGVRSSMRSLGATTKRWYDVNRVDPAVAASLTGFDSTQRLEAAGDKN